MGMFHQVFDGNRHHRKDQNPHQTAATAALFLNNEFLAAVLTSLNRSDR
jgi:hypothetical protein